MQDKFQIQDCQFTLDCHYSVHQEGTNVVFLNLIQITWDQF